MIHGHLSPFDIKETIIGSHDPSARRPRAHAGGDASEESQAEEIAPLLEEVEEIDVS